MILSRHQNSKGRPAQQGFTLTEMIVVVAILAIGMGIFYGVYLVNWSSLDQEITRANMWQDLNKALEGISYETRHAQRIDVTRDSTGNTATLRDQTGFVLMEYTITDAGEFILDPLGSAAGGPAEVLLDNVVFDESALELLNEDLLVTLTLRGDFVGKFFDVTATTEVYPRN